jgi:nitrogen fixation NifU-like protein
MSSVSELYQSVILDHNKTPRNYGHLDSESARHAKGHNPLCGDQVTVWLELEGDVVKEVRFEGQGCAISRASASLMTIAVKGKTVAEVERLFSDFHGLVTGEASPRDGGSAAGAAEGVRERGAVSRAGEVREPGVAHNEEGAGRDSVKRKRSCVKGNRDSGTSHDLFKELFKCRIPK